MARILITGGAGFVGSKIARLFKEADSQNEIHIFDNLKRRGSELNLPLFKELGLEFHHGDLRVIDDLLDLPGTFDLVIDASAEPSVLAGQNGAPHYTVSTNLVGTINTLDYVLKKGGQLLFLSTSRTFSLKSLRELPLVENATRLSLDLPKNSAQEKITGLSAAGIAEGFSRSGARSLYGTTKLASEMMIEEYCGLYGLKAIINRCGVICGAGQFGKTDQGIFSLWIARHYFGKSLSYTGFGGQGKQVRDLLHPSDLFALIQKQIAKPELWDGRGYNVGGGLKISSSLLEWTRLAQKYTGNQVAISSDPATNPLDVPYYVTDHSLATKDFQWSPSVLPEQMVQDNVAWIKANERQLKYIF